MCTAFGGERQHAVVGHVLGHVGGGASLPRHQQGGAGLEQHARRNAVDFAQLCFGHAHQFGGVAGLEGARRDPRGPAGQGPLEQRQLLQEAVGVVVGQQHLLHTSGQDHRLVHLRVQGLEFVQGHARQASGQSHIHVAFNGHAQEVGVVVQAGQRQTQAVGRQHDVLDGLQLGHVVAGLFWHLQTAVVCGLAGALVQRNGTHHVALAPVVGGQGQVPVVEHAVQPLQVVQRRTGGGQHIAPVVAKQVLAQVKVLARGRHELPHARGTRVRLGLRVEGAFDERQQGQLGGHLAPLDLFNDVVQVAPTAPDHALNIVRLTRIELLPLGHPVTLQIDHVQAAAQARPQAAAVSVLLGVQAVAHGGSRGAVGRFRGCGAGGRSVGR